MGPQEPRSCCDFPSPPDRVRSTVAVPSEQQESRGPQDHPVSLPQISITSALPTLLALALSNRGKSTPHLPEQSYVLAMDTSDLHSLPAAQPPSASSTLSRDPSLQGVSHVLGAELALWRLLHLPCDCNSSTGSAQELQQRRAQAQEPAP